MSLFDLSLVSLLIIDLVVTFFFSLTFVFFYSDENKLLSMTHVRFGRSHLHPMGQLTNTRRSDGGPDPDEGFKEVVRIKIRHYRNLYLNHPDPIAFIPLAVDTTGRMYDEFIRLVFLNGHRETSVLDNE